MECRPICIFSYSTDKYCLDHVVDYCEDCACDTSCKDSESHPRALIRDPDVAAGGGYEKQFNMFGSHSESITSKVVKMLGYPVSVIFLVCSLVVVNKYSPRKYWVRSKCVFHSISVPSSSYSSLQIEKSIQTSLVACLTVVYLALFARTVGSLDAFYDSQVSNKIVCATMGMF